MKIKEWFKNIFGKTTITEEDLKWVKITAWDDPSNRPLRVVSEEERTVEGPVLNPEPHEYVTPQELLKALEKFDTMIAKNSLTWPPIREALTKRIMEEGQ